MAHEQKNRDRRVREAEFKAWLAAQGYADSSIATWRSDARKVDNAYDLDQQFDLDGGASMLAELTYSRADEAAGAPNPSRLDYSGPLYSNLADCRAAAKAYFRFRNSEARPQGRFGKLDREAVLEAVAACDAVADVAQYVAGLELGQPAKYWLVLDGKRYPSKAIVRDALARRGSDWLPGGAECKTALERLGFVVIDWPALHRARDAFLRQMPDFSDFRAAAGAYWDVERAYKNALIEQAKAIIARGDDDRAVGESLYRLLSVGGSGLPLSWRTLSEVQNANPDLRDRFYTALGVLARSDGPLEEAVPAAARELEALRDAGIAGLRRGEVLSIPITVWATLRPDQASWFKIAKIDEMGRRLFGRRLFPQTEFRDANLAEWLQLMRALFGLLDKEFGWHPRDMFDVQGFIWVALGDEDESVPDTTETGQANLDLGEGPFWFLGAAFGRTEDQLDRFFEQGFWEISEPGERHREQVLSMLPGQRIAIKSTFTKKQGLPFDNRGRTVSVMAIKATGTITANPGDGERVMVDWDPPFEPREWYHYTYQPTIWEVYPEKELARHMIAFAFAGQPQDVEWVMSKLSNWRDLATFEEAEPEVEIETNALDADPENIILYGPPGTGKTYRTMAEAVRLCLGLDRRNPLIADTAERGQLQAAYHILREKGQIAFVTFHQTFSYEDFVEGLRPVPIKGSAGFELKDEPGIFRTMAEAAVSSPEQFVLIIDEINRANVSKVFGELITLIERDKRLGMPNPLRVLLPYSKREFGVPANLHIIGTMNTADRSIALLDTALRRRFRFEEMAPEPELLGKVDGIDLPSVLAAMNRRIEYLVDRDHRIGHAFFIDCQTKADVDAVMRDKVIPLLQEYFFDDWNRLAAVLGEKDKGGNFLTCEIIEDPMGEGGEPLKSWRVRSYFDEGAYTRLVSARAASPSDLEDQA